MASRDGKLLWCAAAIASLCFPFVVQAKTATPVPTRVSKVEDFQPADGDFAAAYVLDARTKKVLFAYKPDMAWPAASLTKLTNALVFVDRKPIWNSLAQIKKADEVGGGRLRVNDGATMSIRDMLFSSIVGSANNTATAMARLSKLGQKGFINAMNAKVKAIGCKNTVFKDASGMNPGNMTTAADMAKIVDAAFSNPIIRGPASTSYYTFKVRNTGQVKTIKSTNSLLLDSDNGLYVMGGKTGYLEESGNNFVMRVRPAKAAANQELTLVVFGAATKDQMFKAAQSLAQWTWSAYDWRTPSVPALRQSAFGGSMAEGATTYGSK